MTTIGYPLRVLDRADALLPIQPKEEVADVRLDAAGIRRVVTAAPKRTLRVLIADDCRDTTDSLALLVRLWGHDAFVAYSGPAALELAATMRPDVLLVDLAMPGMDGCELARQARRHATLDRSLLVAVTGYADDAHRQLGHTAGFDRYLAKPVEPAAVQELLRQEKHQRATASP